MCSAVQQAMSTCEGSNGDAAAEVSPVHAAAKYASPHIANLNATGQSKYKLHARECTCLYGGADHCSQPSLVCVGL